MENVLALAGKVVFPMAEIVLKMIVIHLHGLGSSILYFPSSSLGLQC